MVQEGPHHNAHCQAMEREQEIDYQQKVPKWTIRESVDSLCRDGADLPRAPYIGKACTRLNGESLGV